MARRPTETTERRPQTRPELGPVSDPGSVGAGPKLGGVLVCLLSVGPFDSVDQAEAWAELAEHHMDQARVPAHIDLSAPADPGVPGPVSVRVIVFAPGLTAALAGVRTLAALRRAST